MNDITQCLEQEENVL